MGEYDSSYYKTINEEEGEQARRLADILMWRYGPSSVIDIGSATGLYLRPFLERGVEVTGVDYSKAVVGDDVLQIPRKLILINDITKAEPKKKADITICLETLEHIPETGSIAAIRYIAKTSNLIIFTAAQPGQGGVGHVNCQPKEYWQSLFEKHGFTRDSQDEAYIKTLIAAGYHLGWLINNLMILKKT